LNAIGSYLRKGVSQKGFVKYFDTPVWIEFPEKPKKEDYQLNIGHVLFTKAGLELAPLSGAQPREGFVDFVKEHWKKFGITTELKTAQQTVQSATDEKTP
jgi:hypothetical protein